MVDFKLSELENEWVATIRKCVVEAKDINDHDIVVFLHVTINDIKATFTKDNLYLAQWPDEYFLLLCMGVKVFINVSKGMLINQSDFEYSDEGLKLMREQKIEPKDYMAQANKSLIAYIEMKRMAFADGAVG